MRLVDRIGNEVIMYGGFPMKRKDIYQDVMTRLSNAKAADFFAFGTRTKVVKLEPLSLEALNTIM